MNRRVLGVFQPGSVHMVGDGFHVRNLFPSNALGEGISPFLLLDYAGPTTYSPTDRPRGIGEHPHRGFETVTIVYQGEVAHRDSAGNSGTIGPGDVQWMTAASGIVHEEKHERAFAKRGGTLQMAQLWVNLPRKSKMTTPRYQEIRDANIPSVEVGSAAGRARVIAGEFRGVRGPAETFSPLAVVDLRLVANGRTELEIPKGHSAGLICLSGRIVVNDEHALDDAEMVLFDREGERVTVRAEKDTIALLLSGEPLGEPVVSMGPFVMNTGQEIYQAMEDYQSGRMGRLD